MIGGGYATGRELAEFFFPAGPWGGLAGMTLALIASGYRALALIFLAVYVAPLMTVGIVRPFPREVVP